MAVYAKSDRFEMVEGFEIRIGKESVKADFGRKVPITEAVKMMHAWLDVIQGSTNGL